MVFLERFYKFQLQLPMKIQTILPSKLMSLLRFSIFSIPTSLKLSVYRFVFKKAVRGGIFFPAESKIVNFTIGFVTMAEMFSNVKKMAHVWLDFFEVYFSNSFESLAREILKKSNKSQPECKQQSKLFVSATWLRW